MTVAAHRWILIAALVAGGSFYFADRVTGPGVAHVLWKGAGVGLLAAWAAIRARSRDGWLLALAMAIYAAADMLLEAAGMVPGAAAFIAGHLAMVALYLRHRRTLASEDWMLAALILAAVPLASFLLPHSRVEGVQVALYATALGAMAAAAFVSGFARDRVLLGAMLFVASDLLIFAKMGPLRDSVAPGLGIWPLYFAGQVLMAVGVSHGLEARGR